MQMKCLVCGSDETEWILTVMNNEDEGFEEYACKTCKSHIEYGFTIVTRSYTGRNDVYPYEEE